MLHLLHVYARRSIVHASIFHYMYVSAHCIFTKKWLHPHRLGDDNGTKTFLEVSLFDMEVSIIE